MQTQRLTRRGRTLAVVITSGFAVVAAIAPATAAIFENPPDVDAGAATAPIAPATLIPAGGPACDTTFRDECRYTQSAGATTDTPALDVPSESVGPDAAPSGARVASDDSPSGGGDEVATPAVSVGSTHVQVQRRDTPSYRDTACPSGPGCQPNDAVATPGVAPEAVGVSVRDVNVDPTISGGNAISVGAPPESPIQVGGSVTSPVSGADLGQTGTVTITAPAGDPITMDLADPTAGAPALG